jgi:hypothetical protein
MQKCQRTSHLTTGSFSLTPSVRSINTRNGFRLCESVKVSRIQIGSLIQPTWDINENIPKDKVSRVVLRCPRYSVCDAWEDLLYTYPDKICMNFSFLPHSAMPSIKSSPL